MGCCNSAQSPPKNNDATLPKQSSVKRMPSREPDKSPLNVKRESSQLFLPEADKEVQKTEENKREEKKRDDRSEELFLEESIRSIEEMDNFKIDIKDESDMACMRPQVALCLLLPSCRAVLCGSLMCQESFNEVLDELPTKQGTLLRDFAQDFASRLSMRQRKRWEEVILGKADPNLFHQEGPMEFGFGCRKEGLLQNDDTALKKFLDKEHSISRFLYENLCMEAPKDALIQANNLWCQKNGWMKGSCTEVQENRTMSRLFKVLDYNLGKQYRKYGGFWEELLFSRDDFLADLEEATEEDGTVLNELDAKILMVIQICKSSLARVPTNYDVEEVRLEYIHIVQVSRDSALEWVGQLGKKGQRSKYAADVITIIENFIEAIDSLSFELLVEKSKSRLSDGPSMLEVAPTVIPSSPYSSPTLDPGDPSLVASGHKGFESYKLRSVY